MADTKHYFDFHFPMPVVEMILALLGRRRGVAAPATAVEPATREWFSQTRNSGDTTTEVVTTSFRLPLSVSELSLEILRMPCVVEVWYQDRSNQWKPVLDTLRSPIRAVVGRSDTKSWYKHQVRCYPIVAKQVQVRLTRTADPELADVPYPVGLRNCLIRRNVYERAQGGAFEDYVDIMGNVVARYIKDWDASRASDDNYTTFWKSAAQPDPSAVVSMCLDVRNATGGPQVVDKVYLDPVYTGQHLNLYYSNDDTVGPRTLSPVTIPATAVDNMEWRPSEGLYDLLTGSGQSSYQFPFKIGPQASQAAWIGVEWRPSFASATANLATNPLLWATNASPDGVFRPTLYYDPGTRRFALQFFDGTDSRVYQTGVLAGDWAAGDPIRVLAGWSYNPNRVYIKVVAQSGAALAELDAAPTTLPTRTSFDGVVEFANIRGTLVNVIAKLDDPAKGAAFLTDPTLYTDPDPVVRDETGRIPSTSLDNAIYAAPFLTREHGCGGSDESHFADKLWTPIWRDYTAIKGFLHLPAPTSMKYLKLEFTNLSEEPYPVYESGIETRYKVFPVAVTQQSSLGPKLYTGAGGFLGLGTFISMNGVRSVNWLNPASVLQAVGAVIGTQTPPVVISTGQPYVTTTLPNSGAQQVESSRRLEAASSYVYARETLQPYVLAADQYTTTIKAEGLQAIQPFVGVPWDEIESANPGAVTKVRSTGTVPIRGTDWWIFPGQTLKIPASVMTRITATQTVTERKFTLERRVRFNTVSVHRYTYRTLKRDTAVAYFAGVREVQPFTASYIPGEDKPIYDFPIYDRAQWVFDPHVVQLTKTDEKGTSVLGPIGINLPGAGTALKTLTTQSDFARLQLNYRDTGLLKSNSLWARTDTAADEQLSPYISILPTSIPTGNWADATKRWADTDAKWGSSFGVISANLNDERRFQGSRVLSFTREADISSAVTPESGVEAGISLAQYVNFVPQTLVRLGLVFYKPFGNSNLIRLRLARASDNTVIHTETFTPEVGKWVEHHTGFVEVPETLANGSFSVGTLSGWTPAGAATWTQDNTVGRTGTGSAKVVKSTGSGAQTLQTEKMLFFASEEISCTAWVKWSGLAATGTAIKVQAVYYSGTTVVSTVDVDGATVSGTAAAAGGWTPVGGTLTAPASGATHVAFQVVVTDGTTGTIWVDDVSATVPGAARQSYNLSLTVVGSSKDTLYVSDLYSQIAPVRYFVQLGGAGSYLHEVTELRYTRAETVLTAPTPVHDFSLRTTVVHPKGWAFGCSAQPLYLK